MILFLLAAIALPSSPAFGKSKVNCAIGEHIKAQQVMAHMTPEEFLAMAASMRSQDPNARARGYESFYVFVRNCVSDAFRKYRVSDLPYDQTEDDVVQDLAIQLGPKVEEGSPRHPDAFKVYIIKAVRNKIINAGKYRKNRERILKENRHQISWLDEINEEVDPEERLDRKRIRGALNFTWPLLSDRERYIFNRLYFEGATQSTVRIELGLSSQSGFETTLARMKYRLRRLIQAYLDGGEEGVRRISHRGSRPELNLHEKTSPRSSRSGDGKSTSRSRKPERSINLIETISAGGDLVPTAAAPVRKSSFDLTHDEALSLLDDALTKYRTTGALPLDSDAFWDRFPLSKLEIILWLRDRALQIHAPFSLTRITVDAEIRKSPVYQRALAIDQEQQTKSQ